MMKRMLAGVLAILMVVGLVGCGASGKDDSKSKENNTAQEEQKEDAKGKRRKIKYFVLRLLETINHLLFMMKLKKNLVDLKLIYGMQSLKNLDMKWSLFV